MTAGIRRYRRGRYLYRSCSPPPVQEPTRELEAVREVGDGDAVQRQLSAAGHKTAVLVPDPDLQDGHVIPLPPQDPANLDELGLSDLLPYDERFQPPDVPPLDTLEALRSDLLPELS